MRKSRPRPPVVKNAAYVLREFRKSYADCLDPSMSDETFWRAAPVRRLTWKSDRRITLSEAVRCYGQMATNYNEFQPEMIGMLHKAFPDAGIQVTPAREYSVAVYLHVPNTPGLRQQVELFATSHFLADEVWWDSDDTLRCWWD